MSVTPEVLRAAVYLETMARADAPFKPSGKTRKTVKCNPPNKPCQGRCIPPNWNCRITGGGLDSHSKAVQYDPVGGTNNLVRGTKNIIEGTQKGDPEKITRGIKGVERGIVKLTPGQTKDEKERFRQRVKAVGAIAFTGILSGIALHRTHRNLSRFPWYANGIGQQIDDAGRVAVDRVLDTWDAGVTRLGWGSMATNRTAIRGRAATAATRLRRQSELFRTTQQGIEGPLNSNNFIANRATMRERGTDLSSLSALDARARSEGWNQARFEAEKARAFYGLRTGGLRGDNHSAFSQPAAHEFLSRQWGFNTELNRRRTLGLGEITSTRELLQRAIADTNEALTADMARRRIRNTPEGVNRYISQLLRENPALVPANLSAPQRRQLRDEFSDRVRQIISASDGSKQGRLAAEQYRNAVTMYDNYFTRIADSLSVDDQGRRIVSPMRPNSAAGVADYGLARFHYSQGDIPVRPRNPSSATFLNRYYYHTRIRPIPGGPSGNRAYPFRTTQQAIATARSFDPSITTAEQARQWFATNRLQVYIPQRRELFRPDSSDDLGLPIRVQSYLQTRHDGPPRANSQGNKGKPCGKSFIPKNEKCKKPVVQRIATAALVAGGVAGTIYALKKAKLREFHTGVMTGDILDEIHVRKRRFGFMKTNQKRTESKAIIDAFNDLKNHKNVVSSNVESFQAFIKKEGIYSDASTFFKDFEDSLSPYVSKAQIDSSVSSFTLNLDLGAVDGLAAYGSSKNVFVRSSRKDIGKLDPKANDIVSAVDKYMDLRKSKQWRSAAFDINTNPSEPGFKRVFHAGSNATDGDAKEAIAFIHEIAHKAHFKASENKGITVRNQLQNTFYDPLKDFSFLQGRDVKGTLEQIVDASSAYGLTDAGTSRAETFAELSVLYMTNGKRFQKEFPLAYDWVDEIWKTANA